MRRGVRCESAAPQASSEGGSLLLQACDQLLGRDPASGDDLASQPTLSRFENTVSRGELLRLGSHLAQAVIDRQRQRRKTARLITIDCDPTCDPTHGQQQLALFNGFYDTACYLPLVSCVSFDNESEQYLVAVLPRSGRAPAKQGLLPVLKRLLPMLRKAFPRAKLRIRLDAGFQGGGLLAYLQREQVRVDYAAYFAALGRYEQALKEHRQAVEEAAAAGRKPPPKPVRPGRPRPRYGQVLYGAKGWAGRWRVLIKADMALHAGREPKANLRFVLTDVHGAARRIYERIYCRRGDAENRLKELKAGLGMDRTSCHRFEANQLRVFLAAAAYVLLQELRWQARETRFARAQV